MTTELRTVGTLSGAPHLIVMLPGVAMPPEALFDAGFAHAIAHRGLPLDLIAVDIDGLGLDAAHTWEALQSRVLTPRASAAHACGSAAFRSVA